MQAAVASTSTIDANASWLSRGPAFATSATRRSASSLQVSAGWRARSTIKCTQYLKQSLSPSGLFGMEVESGRGLRRVQKRVSPLVRAQAAGPSPFSLSASLPLFLPWREFREQEDDGASWFDLQGFTVGIEIQLVFI